MGEGRVGDGGGAGGTAGMSACALYCALPRCAWLCFVWGSGGIFLFFCAASRVPACSCDQDVLFCVGSARLDAIF